MARQRIRKNLNSPQQTCELAQLLAQFLGPGDTILLEGGLGVGKTHFARCLIQELLDIPEDIPSPTYTLVQVYPTAVGDIWHADLYRLTDTSELDELGLSQAFTDAICLVEWPERLGQGTPVTAMTLHLEAPFGDDRRQVTFEWVDPRWTDVLQKILND